MRLFPVRRRKSILSLLLITSLLFLNSRNTLCGSIQCNGGSFNQSSIIFRTTLRLITTFAGPENDRCRFVEPVFNSTCFECLI